MTKIAIWGAGYAGVQAAKHLHKQFRKDKNVEIALYDRNPFHTLMTELHEVAGGRAEPESVQVSLEKIFGGKRVQLKTERISDVHFDNQLLVGETGNHHYDYLILGIGAEPEYFGVPGARENGFSLWSYDDAVKLRRHIEDQFLKASREPNAEKRRSILTFVVAGAGFTGLEMLGELLEWKRPLAEKYGVLESEVSVVLVEAMTDILPLLPKKLREKSLRFLAKKGAILHLNSAITEVQKEKILVKGLGEILTETLIWTCGVKGNELAGKLNFGNGRSSQKPQTVEENNLKFNIQKKCRLQTNSFMQSIEYDNVYVAGDVLWFSEKSRVLPQVVETALQTGKTAAHNIAAQILGREKKTFRSNYHGYLVSIGSKFAVAHVMGVMLSGFVAMGMKHLVNLHYLWDVAGVNSCWTYIKHHFLDVKNNRTLIGGHASAKTPSYWLLPIRVALGAIWFVEFLQKVLKGWLDPSQGPASSWMFSPGVVQAGVDATAAASVAAATTDTVAAATETGKAIDLLAAMNNPILPSDFFLVKIMRWFMDTFVSQIHFVILQYCVVGLELALSLALLGGTFTFLAGVASLVLCLNFTLAGFFTWNQAWMIFASIAMLGGAGKVLGLDYWIMPYLQRFWNRTKFAKRTYLYVDEPTKRKK